MLPLAKLAFQCTQEAPAQITKYCQLMNRPCTASEAVNLSQLLLLNTHTQSPSKRFVSFHSPQNMSSALGGNSLLAAQQLPWATSGEHHGK